MNVKSRKVSIIFKGLIVLIGIISVTAMSGVIDGSFNSNIFTMFTTLSNILCVVYYLAEIIWLTRQSGDKTTMCPILKGICVMCIMLTCLTAQFVLKLSWSFDSYVAASFLGVHYVVPIMSLLDWLIFDKKGQIKVLYPLFWMIAPITYYVAAIISANYFDGLGNGYDISRYPYPFMDTDQLGVNKVAMIVSAISVVYVMFGYVLYGIDVVMCKVGRKEENILD